MTKDKALHSFFSSFGVNAYPANNVPDDVVFPWLTYEMSVGGFNQPVQITLHLYIKTESESAANAQSETICEALRHGGQLIHHDSGAMWLTISQPEWIATPDQNDRTIKHRIINATVEYI